jgi:hypothetical protein
MLNSHQRERIAQHIDHGWKLPDSLANELWETFQLLEDEAVARALGKLIGAGLVADADQYQAIELLFGTSERLNRRIRPFIDVSIEQEREALVSAGVAD